MKRINVIGTTGSGKSTLSRKLADKLGHPYVEMDTLFWKPNWVESNDDEFLPKIVDAVSGSAWVLDGNYSRTAGIKLQRVDTVVWVDLPYVITLLQLFKRTLNRVLTKEELWVDTDNRESFYKSFMSKDSIFVWFFKNYTKNRIKYLKLMSEPVYSHINFIHLRSPKDVKTFLENPNANDFKAEVKLSF